MSVHDVVVGKSVHDVVVLSNYANETTILTADIWFASSESYHEYGMKLLLNMINISRLL